jgi:hypothetical protein
MRMLFLICLHLCCLYVCLKENNAVFTSHNKIKRDDDIKSSAVRNSFLNRASIQYSIHGNFKERNDGDRYYSIQ